MIILGVDPSLRSTGYALISFQKHKLQFIAAGTITTKSTMRFEMKLKHLYDGISEVIEKYKPDVYAIEETFYNKNAKTSLILGHARGALITAAANYDLKVFEYAAKVVKKALTGNGSASKEQVKYMVEQVLNLKDLPEKSFDISDAIAVALTHHHQIKFKLLVQSSEQT